MQWLYHELRELDCLILASPVFFMGLPAQTKAMIDRCQALWVTKYVLKLPIAFNTHKKRKGLFISVGGTNLPNLFQPAIATVKSWFATLDIDYAGNLLFSGIDGKGAIRQHPTALREAFIAGQKLVEGQ
jgi:multimeric flavodoxin WrbA